MAQKQIEVSKSELEESEGFDFETFRQQVIAGLMRGKSLTDLVKKAHTTANLSPIPTLIPSSEKWKPP